MSSEKFDYFIQRTERDIEEIKCSTDRLHVKVDKLLEFKWQIIGGATFVAALISIGVSFVAAVLGN